MAANLRRFCTYKANSPPLQESALFRKIRNDAAASQPASYNLSVQLTTLDWLVVALYFAFNIGIGFYYKARAGSNVSEFFLSGRDVPCWLAGTWLWRNFVASGMLTVFFYARLWRRCF